jgi:cold shock CspA family protein
MRPLTKGHCMRGTMLWFNGDKDLGVIEAADGERLPVRGADFEAGVRLAPRCQGTAVDFRVVEGPERHAAAVSVVPDIVPRRARSRGRHTYSS